MAGENIRVLREPREGKANGEAVDKDEFWRVGRLSPIVLREWAMCCEPVSWDGCSLGGSLIEDAGDRGVCVGGRRTYDCIRDLQKQTAMIQF
jgi:hypothetical protein